MAKAYKIELLVLDLNGNVHPNELQVGETPPEFEFATIMKVESRDVDWSDDHPLNQHKTQIAAYQNLFKDKP